MRTDEVKADSPRSRPKLDAKRLRVQEGGEWFDVTDDQMQMLIILFEAAGDWVQGPCLTRRPDKRRKEMPPRVAALIETHKKNGYRIPALLPK